VSRGAPVLLEVVEVSAEPRDVETAEILEGVGMGPFTRAEGADLRDVGSDIRD
jgi:hypothetical protein